MQWLPEESQVARSEESKMRRGLRRLAVSAAAAALTVSGLGLATATTSSDRIAGGDRHGTAVEISKLMTPGSIGTVFVASGESYPDAIVGGAIAGAYGYPVLLTGRTSLSAKVRAELERLEPLYIVLLGGPKAISYAVEDELGKFGHVTRLEGPNRYATAVMASRWGYEPGLRVAYLASGQNFADALSGGVAAARTDGPVLLTKSTQLSAETAAHLAEFKPRRIVILGGEAAVSQRVAEQAAQFAPVVRVAGPDRYATSAAVSATNYTKASTVLVASGTTFPDALSGTPLAAKLRAPILLVKEDSVPTSVCNEVRRLGPSKVIALGGKQVVSDAVIAAAQKCAGPNTAKPVQPEPTPTITAGPAGSSS